MAPSLLEERVGLLTNQLLEMICGNNPSSSTVTDEQLVKKRDADVKTFAEGISTMATSDVGTDVELVFRRSLDILFMQSSGSGSTRCSSFKSCSNKNQIVELLHFAIELGKIGAGGSAELSPNIPKIPFLLIEDLLQGQTLSNAFIIWEIVESLVDTLTLPILFNRGKFIILRTCNALLRRLSRSCHTEFCGRVLMFLASIYPLSEKSAVNLTGKVNVGNVTYFEDEETFSTASGSSRGGSSGSQDVSGGKRVADRSTDSDAMEVVLDGGGDRDQSPSHVDYQLYKAFWEVQGFLSADPKVLEQKNKWPELMKCANTLLSTFEANSSSKSELKQSKLRREKEIEKAIRSTSSPAGKVGGDSTDSRSHYMGCKYLTSSQLFALELQDPSIRQQLAIQLLVTLHYRMKTSPPPPVSSAPPVAPKESEILELETRIYKLLENTPPCGDELTVTLKSIFSGCREDGWLKWKQDHCPSFEKEPTPRAGDRKRKRQAASSSSSGVLGGGYYFSHEWGAMQTAVKALVGRVPSLEVHMTDFVDAEDPDAGIEDEFHPKHDTVFCWRARRLMAANKLSVFEDMAEGNIAKGIRLLGMLPEPVEDKATVDEVASSSRSSVTIGTSELPSTSTSEPMEQDDTSS